MTSSTPIPQHLWAVASAVYVAVTGDIDRPDGGDHPVRDVTDIAALKAYVEAYLDGYEVSDASLAAALGEGPALTESTLKELISQAAAAGMRVDEFFDANEVDIQAGLSAAASFDPDAAPAAASVREQLFSAWLEADEAGTCLFVEPRYSWSSMGLHAVAKGDILDRGLPLTTPYFGWGGDRDQLRPDGTFKKGTDLQNVFWRGDEAVVRQVLQRAEQFGYAVEGGLQGTRFRLVAADNPTSTAPNALPVRDDLLSQAAMVDGELGPVGYATSWVEKSRQPKAETDKLTAEQARILVEAGEATDLFIYPDLASAAIPWCIKLRPKKKATVTHYHSTGSVARVVEFRYAPITNDTTPLGQLIRGKVSDYLWPTDHARYAVKGKAERTVHRVDHDGVLATVRESGPDGEVTHTFRDDVVRADRIAYPAFGNWAELADPFPCDPIDPTAFNPLLIDFVWRRDGDEVWAEDGDRT